MSSSQACARRRDIDAEDKLSAAVKKLAALTVIYRKAVEQGTFDDTIIHDSAWALEDLATDAAAALDQCHDPDVDVGDAKRKFHRATIEFRRAFAGRSRLQQATDAELAAFVDRLELAVTSLAATTARTPAEIADKVDAVRTLHLDADRNWREWNGDPMLQLIESIKADALNISEVA